jgi:hypothetical protein
LGSSGDVERGGLAEVIGTTGSVVELRERRDRLAPVSTSQRTQRG